MNKTVIYSHQDCLRHDPGYGHPESPERLQTILENIDHYEKAPLGTEQQVLLAHNPELLAQIKALAPSEGLAQIDADTLMSPASLRAALRGTGAACKAIDELIAGNIQHAFCATRPPGHHATENQAMGFCLFNHIAIAALYAQQKHGVERIAIVDFDVHHGNGTQDIVQGKQGLFYISTHQSPFYPGTGNQAENSPGNILNIPLSAGTDHSVYLQIFNEQVIPALKDFKPQLLLVSAGFDAHHEDPLAALDFTDLTYQYLGEQLAAIAKEYCQSRLLSILEGGYNIEVLSSSIQAYLNGAQANL
ncbi:MAG: acetoin utilization protein [SAR86 cluster bacterium]|uniref:histone deacetylase n=1 Tax=SAR86 cluster bacterium TaxID=2030880 RepID=A0A2A5CFA7_9GAMM|nr:histone deacetylase family protein [Gammaproteobacteria bacterium AH-315-E17]PCJ42557.1 MAG: acetoin utilization protein [SAR86 cluster bacterium]